MDQLTVATHNHKLELWIGRIRECMTSGKTVADWCEDNDVNIKTYYYWMRKVKREAFESLPATRHPKAVPQTTQSSPFVELSIPENLPTNTVRVYLTKAIVEIPDGTTGITISEVLNSVTRLC